MFKDGPIEGLNVKELKLYDDERGWLSEIFREDEIDKEIMPVMSYISATNPGKIRGPHEHISQTDYFVFFGPGNFLFLSWDNRKNSKTYMNRYCAVVGAKNRVAIIVPPGVVHGYSNVSDSLGIVYNCPNKLYAGWGKKEAVDEVRHEDDKDSPFVVDFINVLKRENYL